MARLKELRYSVKAVVNLGNYQNVTFEYGEVLEPAQGDDVVKLRANLLSRVKRIVEKDVLEARRDAEQK